MNRKIKPFLVLGIVIGQIIINRYVDITKFNADLPFLIIVYIAIRSSMTKSLIWGSVIGWITDTYTGGIIGLFGFSRTIAALLLSQMQRFLDLTRAIFVFLLIFISMALSNLVANLFFGIIFQTPFSLAFILQQPFFTALVGAILSILPAVRDILHVE